MKVSEIAEQLAKNPNTVFSMKQPYNYGKDAWGRIVEVVTVTQGKSYYSQFNTRKVTAYKVEIMGWNFGKDENGYTDYGKRVYKPVMCDKHVLPQHIYHVRTDTETLEELCETQASVDEKWAQEKAKLKSRRETLITYLVNAVGQRTSSYDYEKLWDSTLEALAKALGYTEQALDTSVCDGDTVLIGGN